MDNFNSSVDASIASYNNVMPPNVELLKTYIDTYDSIQIQLNSIDGHIQNSKKIEDRDDRLRRLDSKEASNELLALVTPYVKASDFWKSGELNSDGLTNMQETIAKNCADLRIEYEKSLIETNAEVSMAPLESLISTWNNTLNHKIDMTLFGLCCDVVKKAGLKIVAFDENEDINLQSSDPRLHDIPSDFNSPHQKILIRRHIDFERKFQEVFAMMKDDPTAKLLEALKLHRKEENSQNRSYESENNALTTHSDVQFDDDQVSDTPLTIVETDEEARLVFSDNEPSCRPGAGNALKRNVISSEQTVPGCLDKPLKSNDSRISQDDASSIVKTVGRPIRTKRYDPASGSANVFDFPPDAMNLQEQQYNQNIRTFADLNESLIAQNHMANPPMRLHNMNTGVPYEFYHYANCNLIPFSNYEQSMNWMGQYDAFPAYPFNVYPQAHANSNRQGYACPNTDTVRQYHEHASPNIANPVIQSDSKLNQDSREPSSIFNFELFSHFHEWLTTDMRSSYFDESKREDYWKLMVEMRAALMRCEYGEGNKQLLEDFERSLPPNRRVDFSTINSVSNEDIDGYETAQDKGAQKRALAEKDSSHSASSSNKHEMENVNRDVPTKTKKCSTVIVGKEVNSELAESNCDCSHPSDSNASTVPLMTNAEYFGSAMDISTPSCSNESLKMRERMPLTLIPRHDTDESMEDEEVNRDGERASESESIPILEKEEELEEIKDDTVDAETYKSDTGGKERHLINATDLPSTYTRRPIRKTPLCSGIIADAKTTAKATTTLSFSSPLASKRSSTPERREKIRNIKCSRSRLPESPHMMRSPSVSWSSEEVAKRHKKKDNVKEESIRSFTSSSSNVKPITEKSRKKDKDSRDSKRRNEEESPSVKRPRIQGASEIGSGEKLAEDKKSNKKTHRESSLKELSKERDKEKDRPKDREKNILEKEKSSRKHEHSKKHSEKILEKDEKCKRERERSLKPKNLSDSDDEKTIDRIIEEGRRMREAQEKNSVSVSMTEQNAKQAIITENINIQKKPVGMKPHEKNSESGPASLITQITLSHLVQLKTEGEKCSRTLGFKYKMPRDKNFFVAVRQVTQERKIRVAERNKEKMTAERKLYYEEKQLKAMENFKAVIAAQTRKFKPEQRSESDQ